MSDPSQWNGARDASDTGDAPDAVDIDPCPLPASYCYDPFRLVVFSNGVCKAGVCDYTWSFYDCRSLPGTACESFSWGATCQRVDIPK